MSGSHASVSKAERAVVVTPNWLGDALMSMPAIQAFAAERGPVAVLTKPPLAPLWRLHPDVAEIIEQAQPGTRARLAGFDAAYVLPNSFRSAWIPWRARVPRRVGAPARFRRWMLTEPRPRSQPGDPRHQAHENFRLLGVEAPDQPRPRLRLPADAAARAGELLPGPTTWLGLVPGAARGPSKRWPLPHFIELARRLAATPGLGLALFGTGADAAACAELRAGLPAEATVVDLAGRTDLQGFAAALARCAVVVANDSGGMHLAAALGTATVGVFGLTDPSRTAPLGERVTVLQHSGIRDRDIARDSAAAAAALAAVTPDEVEGATRAFLEPA